MLIKETINLMEIYLIISIAMSMAMIKLFNYFREELGEDVTKEIDKAKDMIDKHPVRVFVVILIMVPILLISVVVKLIRKRA